MGSIGPLSAFLVAWPRHLQRNSPMIQQRRSLSRAREETQTPLGKTQSGFTTAMSFQQQRQRSIINFTTTLCAQHTIANITLFSALRKSLVVLGMQVSFRKCPTAMV